MLRFRELEHTTLHAGLGVQLVDAHTGAAPFGWTKIELDIAEAGGAWRPLDKDLAPQRRTASGVTWFPWLERHYDARGMSPRMYRVRVAAEFSTPQYLYNSAGVIVVVSPYDDVTAPVPPPFSTVVIRLLPSDNYPFAPNVPVLRGKVVDGFSQEPVHYAAVRWIDMAVQTDSVLTDEDGEFRLPMKRAPIRNTPFDVRAERPPPPLPLGRYDVKVIRLPLSLPTYHVFHII